MPNPISRLAQKHGVPVAHIARALQMNRHHVTRYNTGALPTPYIVRLACEALDTQWSTWGHGYKKPIHWKLRKES